jgi:hypothetical protein
MSESTPKVNKKTKIELPSQNEMEKFPIPDEPLSWEFLQQLHEPEEMERLIKERHGLDSGELFTHTPQKDRHKTVFDRHYLLKLALFRLEIVDWSRIEEFFDTELKDHGKTDLKKLLMVIISRYFSGTLKTKISINIRDIEFSVKRAAEKFKCRIPIDRICRKTLLPIKKVFSKPPIYFYTDINVDFDDLCNYFLISIQNEKSKKSGIDAGKVNSLAMQTSIFFSKEARAFLPNNISRARNEAKRKAREAEQD